MRECPRSDMARKPPRIKPRRRKETMPDRTDPVTTVQDSVLASSLVLAPAWAPWLSELNQLLTTLTLVVGLALGAGRLWVFLRERLDRNGRQDR